MNSRVSTMEVFHEGNPVDAWNCDPAVPLVAPIDEAQTETDGFAHLHEEVFLWH